MYIPIPKFTVWRAKNNLFFLVTGNTVWKIISASDAQMFFPLHHHLTEWSEAHLYNAVYVCEIFLIYSACYKMIKIMNNHFLIGNTKVIYHNIYIFN